MAAKTTTLVFRTPNVLQGRRSGTTLRQIKAEVTGGSYFPILSPSIRCFVLKLLTFSQNMRCGWMGGEAMHNPKTKFFVVVFQTFDLGDWRIIQIIQF